MNVNESLSKVVELVIANLSTSVHALVTCKQHEVVINNTNVIEVSCELCSKTSNITNRALPKLIAAATDAAKEIQTKNKDKARVSPSGDITHGRIVSIRKRDDGNTIAILVLKKLVTREELDAIRSIHPSYSLSFTAMHQTKRAGENKRNIETLKNKKQRSQHAVEA